MIRCLWESCERTTKGGRGLCKHHYQIQYRARIASGEDTSRFVTVGCKEEGCNSDHLAKGFCGIHYRAVNKDRLRVVNKAWYESNKEIRLAQIKEYRETNKDLVTEWNKNWWREHPEALKAKKSRRRQRENTYTSSEDRKQSVLKRIELKNFPCVYCGEYADEMHVDHALPLCRGGLDIAGNLLQSCRSCNSRKHAKTAEEFIELLETERMSAYVEREKENKL